MNCRLIQDIKHSCDYNAGGITDIYLLDIRDFVNYQFKGDRLFNECLIELIKIKEVDYIKLDTVTESNFTETEENGVYKQTLSTFVGTLDYSKTSNLLLAKANKYLVVFSNSQGRLYSFGSDGGASVSFAQQSGQLGEVSGYSVTITKNSLYPLFEVDSDKFNKILVLGTENNMVVSTEEGQRAILIN